MFRNKYAARIVFGAVILLSILSVLLTILSTHLPVFGSVLGLSVLLNLWALFQNSQGGFVRSRQIWRADEPRRRFDTFQVILVYLMLVLQGAALLFTFI